MVRGLDTFKKYFEAYPENYVVIGGTACDAIIEGANLIPRATKDIDIILIVEALSTAFVAQFWQFINNGKYERREKSGEGRQYYRFIKPADPSFPLQVELFSRAPVTIELPERTYLTPIPVDDDLSSLSAILMDDSYYEFIIEHSIHEDGLHFAKTEALICLKAKAFLEIKERIAGGGTDDKRQLKKHKADVFRLAVIMKEGEIHELPAYLKEELQSFMDIAATDLPDKAIFKEMGLGNIPVKNIYDQLLKTFQLRDNKDQA